MVAEVTTFGGLRLKIWWMFIEFNSQVPSPKFLWYKKSTWLAFELQSFWGPLLILR